jgi:hypothetical protein
MTLIELNLLLIGVFVWLTALSCSVWWIWLYIRAIRDGVIEAREEIKAAKMPNTLYK